MGFFTGSHAVAVVGTVGTGKTQALVEGVAAALGSKVRPEEVLVFAASPAAARALRARLAHACGPLAHDVRVTTPLAWARAALAHDGAVAAHDGRSHVLCDFEENFFLEDMRVTGQKQRRLKEMLKFLQRGWSEMREDEQGWLITGEEVALNDFARARLACMGAYLPAEASAACVRYLCGDPQALEAARATRVFADDYRLMSRASQRLVRLLARERVTVAWDRMDCCLRGEESYGFADGLDELAADAAGAGATLEHVELAESRQARAPHAAVANLLAQACLDAPAVPALAADAAPGAFCVRTADGLEDEMGQVARVVAEALAQGVDAREIFVATPSDAWSRRVAAELGRAGIASSRVEGRQALGGDIRDLTKSAAAAVYTALHLAAFPASAAAWRCWCGFGDYLACSSAFDRLAGLHAQTGVNLPSLLEGLAEGAVACDAADVHKVRDRYERGRAMLRAARGLAGRELVAELAAHTLGDRAVPAALECLLGDVAAGASARELYGRARSALVEPVFADEGVRIGGFDCLVGQAPRIVLFCGMVNGLVPREEYFELSLATIEAQDKMHRKLVARLAGACGKARDAIVCSTFEHAGIVESETLRLKTERVRLRDGRRVCDLGPSVCIQYMRGEKLRRER